MDLLDVVRRQIERGEHQKARRVLVSLVKQRPDSIPAWSLLAGLVSDPAHQADCYRRILALDPANAQAAAALQRLTEPSRQPGSTLPCPQCGGKLIMHIDGETKDKRAVCQHCGAEMDLPDAYRRIEHQHERERHSAYTPTVDRTVIETRTDDPEVPGTDELAQQTLSTLRSSSSAGTGGGAAKATEEGLTDIPPLEEKELTGGRHENRVPDGGQLVQGMPQLNAEKQVTPRVEQENTQVRSWPGLLKWFQGGSRNTTQGEDTTPQQDESSLLLSPEELIRAAGGPLPPEERRKCPECGTTVPKQASRCGWCGTSFSES